MELFGMLTLKNIKEVSERFQQMFAGKSFAIAKAEYADSKDAQVKLITDAVIDSSWTEEAMKEHQITRNAPVLLCLKDNEISFSFSAGGYFWTFSGDSEGNGYNEDLSRKQRGTYFVFEHDSVRFEQMAPAGSGLLHKYLFKIQRGV